jgi:hypothetical protein
MNFCDLSFLCHFLQIPPDRIFRYLHLLAQMGREDFVVQIYLMKDIGLAFFF